MKNPIYALTISKAIITLNKEFPGIPIGEHIANALQGLDIYNIMDKDLADMLTTYIDDITLDDFYRHNVESDYPSDE